MADPDWAQSVLRLLEAAGVGTRAGTTAGTWGLYRDARPASELKDGQIMVLERTGGIPPFSNIPGYRHYEFTIRTIGKSNDPSGPEDAQQKAEEVYDFLTAQGPKTSSDGRVFDLFEPLSHPDRDTLAESGGLEYIAEYRTVVRE